MNPLLIDQLAAAHRMELLAAADRHRAVRHAVHRAVRPAGPGTARRDRLRRALSGVRRLLPQPAPQSAPSSAPRQVCCA